MKASRKQSKNKKPITHSSKSTKTNKPSKPGRAEKSLQPNEDHFQRIFDEGPLGMAFVSLDFHFTRVNATFCKMMGYSKRELLSMTFADITHPEYVTKDIKSIKKLIKGILPVYRTEKRYIRKDRQVIWGAVTVTVVRDKNNQFQYMLAMIENITDRRKAEEQLLIKDSAIETSISAVGLSDLKGKIIYTNKAYVKLWGYKNKNEILGRNITDFAQSKEQVEEVTASIQKVGMYFGEVKVLKKDGTPIDVQISVNLVSSPEGKPICMMASFIDITERKRMEARVRLSEEHYRTLVETTPDAIIILGDTGNIMFASRKSYEVFGIPVDQPIIGKSLLGWIAPEHYADVMGRLSDILSGQVKSEMREYALCKFDGTPFWGEINSSRIINSRGEVTGLLLVCRDVSERKTAAEALMVSERRLQKAQMIAHVGNWELDLKTNKMWASEEAFRIYGLEQKSHELPLDVVQSLVIKTDRIPLDRALQGLIARKGEYNEVFQIKRSNDGEVRTLSSIAELVYGSDGNPEKVVGVIQDITERKLIEDAVREKDKQFKELFENAPVGYHEIDGKGNIVTVNQTELNMLGYSLNEMVGWPVWEFVADKKESQTRVHDKLKGLLPPNKNTEQLYTRRDGTTFPVIVDDSILKNDRGEIIGIRTTILDITVRKQAMEALAREQYLLNMLMDNIPDHIYFKDKESRFIRINKAHATRFGLGDPADAVGKTDFDFFTEQHAKRAYEDEQNIIRTSQPLIGAEEKETWPDGEETWVSTTKMPLLDSNGEIIGTFGSSKDITNGKHAEEALRESQALYHSFVEHMPAGVFRKDSKGRYVFVNSYFCQLKGLKSEEILGKTPHELEAYQSKIIASRPSQLNFAQLTLADQGADHHKLIMRTGRPIELEEIYHLPDGSTRYFQVIKSPVFSSDGKIIGTQGIQFDITDRKLAEQELQHSEIKYREMVEQINDIIFSIDAHGIYTYISPAAEIISGYKPEEVIGHPLEEFLDPMFIPKYKKQIQKIISGVLEPSEYRIRIKSGEYRWVRSSSKPVFDGDRLLGVRGVLTDITERKKAEEALNLLSHTIKSISECVSVTDLHNNIMYINQAFQDTYGYTEEEVIGKNISNIVYTNETDKTEILAATLRGEWHGERINRKKDGTEFPIFLSTSTVYDELGDPIALVGVATDITEQKKLQQELLQSQKMQSIGTLAGGVAHDFNNILGIILGYASLLEKHKSDDQKYSESISAINSAVQRGASLVRQILTFARKTDVDFEVINVNDLVHELLSMLQQTFPKLITFKEITEKNIPYIQADRTQIHQALLNLCVNARDAMPNGGSLTMQTELVSREKIQNQFRSADQNAYACVSVTDTGEGMDEATLDRIFDPFFTTKEKGKGTGLGLSVTYGVMQTHHGYVHAESALGHGSTFRLYFPVSDTSEKLTDSNTSAESFTTGGTETILIVEDEELLNDMVRFLLETSGYKAYAAKDGIEAVNIYKDHSDEIALVLSDMGLPGMTGSEVFKKLKEINPNAKVLLASGFFDPNDKSELLKAGAKGFIPKPYLPEDVLRGIRKALDSKIE
jgi:two-component system, cell cycle sensor histidine kinase and response regulator CckA